MFVVNPALPFNPQCGVVGSDDDTAYIVNCAAPSGTQAIAQASYSVNGADRGSGIERHLATIMTRLSSFSLSASFPLEISISSLMAGTNVIIINLEGTDGATATANLTVGLGNFSSSFLKN